MDNLKKIKFTKLDSSEMKQVKGGGVVEDTVAAASRIVNSTGLVKTLNNLLTSLLGSGG
ncbi:hypothetical protein Q1W71_20405 [Flavobacterium pectinovorum]|uniref:hypothetical protein n=1 Tax=Flavobacterium pectinovorum TaxID=29533 RepID=UPI00266028B5|nr:hypothetical protein [Flavobacterium pectinovorum]WKL47311.1 hypothetical protein Q1W71_20405 [Flavobacterium pectinovorum]